MPSTPKPARGKEQMGAALTVRLPPSLLAALEALAEREERTLADAIRRVLRRGLDAGPAVSRATSRRRA